MKAEQSTVHQIMTYLVMRGILCYRTRNTGTIIHGPRGIVYGRDRYWRTQAGCPDILAWDNGKAYGIEVKSKTGRVRPEQELWLSRFRDEGGVGIVARSLEDVMEVVK